MPADPRLDRIRGVATRVAADYDLDIFDVQLRREAVGWVLRVVIDRPPRRDQAGCILVEPVEAAIGIDECQRVSQDLDALLDVEDALDQRYVLEVSSPGLDRPLRHLDDCRRFEGRLAKIVVREPIDGQRHFEGRLCGVGDGRVLVDGRRNGPVSIPWPLVSRARLAVEF